MNKLNLLLAKAANGSPNDAFNAARKLEEIGSSEVLVQTHYRKAANGGHSLAQLHLGILGLCGKLLDPNSSYMSEAYYTDPSHGVYWLKKSAENGNMSSAYVYALCLLHGIGIPQDADSANHLLHEIASKISTPQLLSSLMIIYHIQSLHHLPSPMISPHFFNEKVS